MMKSHMKKLEGCARLLEIQAEEGELKTAQEGILHDFEKVSRISGFRVGKAPRHLVAKQYAKEIRDEILKRLVPELYHKALQESRLKAIGLPEISEVRLEDHAFSFKTKFEVEPEVVVRKYKGLKAVRKPVGVTPDEVQHNLRAIQDQQAELVPKEGAVEENDFVVCDVEGRVNGKVTESRKNLLLQTSSKDQKYPQVTKALLGAKAGDLREADVDLESPGGVVQKTHYKIQIHEVKRKNLPEMNDDFVKSIGRFQTVDELKEAISKEIREKKEREAKQDLERELLDQLKKTCPFDVPRLLVERETKRLIEEQHFQLKFLGWPDQEIETKVSQNQAHFQKEAEMRVRNAFILEKIAETENIKVQEEEMDEKIRSFSGRMRRNEAERKEDLVNPSLRQRISGEILFEKALSVVMSHAQIQ